MGTLPTAAQPEWRMPASAVCESDRPWTREALAAELAALDAGMPTAVPSRLGPVAAFDALVEAAEGVGDPGLVGWACLLAAQRRQRDGDAQAMLDLALRAAALFDTKDGQVPLRLRIEAHRAVGYALLRCGRIGDTLERIEWAQSLIPFDRLKDAADADLPLALTSMRTVALLGCALGFVNLMDAAAQVFERLLGLFPAAVWAAFPEERLLTLTNLAYSLVKQARRWDLAGDAARAEALLDRARAILHGEAAELLASGRVVWNSRQNYDDALGSIALMRGELAEAEAAFRHMTALGEEAGVSDVLGYAQRGLAGIALARGDADEAERLAMSAFDRLERFGDTEERADVLAIVAAAQERLGRPADALASLKAAQTMRDRLRSVATVHLVRYIEARVDMARLQAENLAQKQASDRLSALNDRLCRQAEALEAAKACAEAANREKTRFLAYVMHEIRNPLSAVLAFTEVVRNSLGDGALADLQRGWLANVDRSVEHTMALINDLLDLEKVEAGRLEVDWAEVDLCDCVREAVRLMAPKAAIRRQDMQTELPLGPVFACADRRRVVQVLLNLLSNAVKFTPDGGVVLAGLERAADGAIVLFVADSGIGMTETEIALALEPYGQVAGAREALSAPSRGEATESVRADLGSGLGLPLAGRLLDLMGWDLEIRSRPGRGTVVRIRVPPPTGPTAP